MTAPTASTRAPARRVLRLLAELTGFALLLFVMRFVLRAHLVPQMDEECHVGAIAIDVLAHGVRFPLLVYAPLEYQNGSFFGGLAAAGAFLLFGRNVLALKLVTHGLSAITAVAMLALLRRCLAELRVTERRARWAAVATLVVSVALAPRLITMASMGTVGFGGPGEGTALQTLLLALFATRWHARTSLRTAVYWALVGATLYLNKATIVLLPVLGALEVALTWPAWPRLVAAAAGLLVGQLPGVAAFANPQAAGWQMVIAILRLHLQSFPYAFGRSALGLADGRPLLVVVWAIALLGGAGLLAQAVRAWWRGSGDRDTSAPPVALPLVVGVAWTHLTALAVMAKGGPVDHYAVFGYPTLAVLVALLVGALIAAAAARWGVRAATWSAVAAVLAMIVVYRPDAIAWEPGAVRELWHNRAGAACSWHLAEGFAREHQYGLAPPGRTREQHAIARCRSLPEPDLVLDCVGGIARELHVRRGARVDGEPPAELTADERRAYAFYYGVHRENPDACADFRSPELQAECAAAVQLEALFFVDINTRYYTGRGLGRPRCVLPEPPMHTYWAAFRTRLLTSTTGTPPYLARQLDDMSPGRPIFEACYDLPDISPVDHVN